MTKKELISMVAENGNMTKKDAAAALDTVVSTIMGILDNKDSVTLAGFGKFYTEDKEARIATNPRTKEKIDVPAKTVPKFKFSPTYKKSFGE